MEKNPLLLTHKIKIFGIIQIHIRTKKVYLSTNKILYFKIMNLLDFGFSSLKTWRLGCKRVKVCLRSRMAELNYNQTHTPIYTHSQTKSY